MDSERTRETRADILKGLHRSWDDLQTTIVEADESGLVTLTDAAGWSCKDHLAHLAAWEHSIVVLLEDGRPRWEGLGIDKELYEAEGWDEKNEVIRRKTIDWPLDRVTSHLTNVRKELIRIIKGMSDEDLLEPRSDFERATSNSDPIGRLIAIPIKHTDDHRLYIERILARQG